MVAQTEERPTAVLVAVQLASVSDEAFEADLAELGRLCDTLGLRIVGRVTQRRGHARAGTVLGLGKIAELAAWTGGSGNTAATVGRKNKLKTRREREEAEALAEEEALLAQDDEIDEVEADEDAPRIAPSERAKVVVVDAELSPGEQRNLERATDAEVMDRTSVIVEIFHRHAKSREARLQVEIARLNYVAPRLRESGAGADRQRGGVGGKGAGESAVELDRRKIRDRVAELRRELEVIQHEQATRRAARREQRRVALVGYTNAGKSSLMRALTGSEVYVANKLFATLDTTVRALKPETVPRILVSDTVGFIKKLPHELVASFRSTLDEALEASLLLYVVDASDPTFRDQLDVTQSVLGEIGANDVPSRIVLNKIDRVDQAGRDALLRAFPDALFSSAFDKEYVAALRNHIAVFFDGELIEDDVFLPYARYGSLARIRDTGVVVGENHGDEGTTIRLRAPKRALERLREELDAGAT